MVVGGKQFSFSRSTQDMVKGGDANKGAHLVASMNAVQMVVMNGIDSGGEFTFRTQKRGHRSLITSFSATILLFLIVVLWTMVILLIRSVCQSLYRNPDK